MRIRPKAGWMPEAKQFFKQITSEFDFTDDEALILQGSCQALSNFWQASRQIDMEGLTVTSDSGMSRKNPCCEIQKNSWAAFLSGCRVLQIGSPPELKNRPGRPDGGGGQQ